MIHKIGAFLVRTWDFDPWASRTFPDHNQDIGDRLQGAKEWLKAVDLDQELYGPILIDWPRANYKEYKEARGLPGIVFVRLTAEVENETRMEFSYFEQGEAEKELQRKLEGYGLKVTWMTIPDPLDDW